jgi:hypothetical protein
VLKIGFLKLSWSAHIGEISIFYTQSDIQLFQIWHSDMNFFNLGDSLLFLSSTSSKKTEMPPSSFGSLLQPMVYRSVISAVLLVPVHHMHSLRRRTDCHLSAPSVGVLTWQTYQGGTWGSRLCGGGSLDLKLEGKSEDTRHKFIQVWAAEIV